VRNLFDYTHPHRTIRQPPCLQAFHSPIPPFPHSIIQSFNHSLIPSFPHSLIPSFPHSLIQSFNHSLILSFPHSLIPSFNHSLIHSFIYPLFLQLSFLSKTTFPKWDIFSLLINNYLTPKSQLINSLFNNFSLIFNDLVMQKSPDFLLFVMPNPDFL
jgi:hypothetical protein